MATALIAAALTVEPGLAAGKKHVHRAGGSAAGGVMLSTPEPHTAIEHNNRGVELGTKGLWPDAIREHEQALEMEPSNKDFMTNLSAAHLRYGDVLAARHDIYNAMKQYRHALFVDPGNNVAEAHLDDCIARLKKDPTDFKVRQKMAEDADVSQDYETAIVEYRRCAKMRDDGPTHAELGRVLLKAGKDVDGFAELKIAVSKTWEPKTDKRLMRDLADCHRQLGDILKQYAYKARDTGRGTVGMKRLLNAGIEYRRAVTINPDDSDAIKSLVEVSREAVAIRPSFDNTLMLGAAYQLAGDFEHAKMEYEQCWKIDPRRSEIAKAQQSYHLAVARSGLASPAMVANTVDKVQKAVSKDPSDAMWWYVLGRAKQTQFERTGSQEDREAALDAYQHAYSINPYISPDLQPALRVLGGAAPETAGQPAAGGAPGRPSAPAAGGSAPAAPTRLAAAGPPVSAKTVLQYGAIEQKLGGGDLDGAQKDLLEIVDKNAGDGHAWLLLGNTYEKKGDLDQAIVAYRQAALLKEPGADDALDTVSDSRIQPLLKDADAKVQQGDLVGAAASLREALSIAPGKPIVHQKLSDILRKMGDAKGADKEQKKATELAQGKSGSVKK